MAYVVEFDPERPAQRHDLKPDPRIAFDDGAVYELDREHRPVGSEMTHLTYLLVEGPNPA